MPGLTHWQSPRFFAYFANTGSEPGILAELLAAGLNQVGILWRTSPALQELEEVTLDWLAQLLGLPPGLHGHLEDTASTGTMAALDAQRAGTALPFATLDAATGEVIGSTRFGNIDLSNRRAEIGWTWLRRDRQRTACNTEAKYLMLRHAFDVLGCIRVELKTDALNQQSRAAILRIGAVEEGILRAHMITASGRLRDSVYYSILDREWPAVRERLEGMLTTGNRGRRGRRGERGI